MEPATGQSGFQLRRYSAWTALIITLVIALLGAWQLRVSNLTESLWVDELHTSWTIRGDFSDVDARARWGNQPPLYFWLQWLSGRAVGQSETQLRMTSVVAGMVVVGLIGFLAWRITGSRLCVLLALSMSAIDQDLVYFAQEARSYAALQLLGTLHLILILRRFRPLTSESAGEEGLKSDLLTRLGCILTLVIAVYIHYTALWLVIADAAVIGWFLVTDRRRVTTRTRPAGIDVAVAVMCLLPAAPAVADVLSRQEDWSLISTVWPLPNRLAVAISTYLIPAVVLSCVGWLIHRRVLSPDASSATKNDGRRWCATLIYAVVPVGLAWWLARFDVLSSFLPRYYVMFLPALIAFAAASCGWFRSPIYRVAASSFLFLVACAQSDLVLESPRLGRAAIQRGEGWRDAIEWLNRRRDAQSQDVYLMSNLIEDHRLNDAPSEAFVEYLRFPVTALYPLEGDTDLIVPRPTFVADRFRPQDLDRITASPISWFVVRGSQSTLAEVMDDLADALADREYSFDADVDMFGSVFVAEVRPRPFESDETNDP